MLPVSQIAKLLMQAELLLRDDRLLWTGQKVPAQFILLHGEIYLFIPRVSDLKKTF